MISLKFMSPTCFYFHTNSDSGVARNFQWGVRARASAEKFPGGATE